MARIIACIALTVFYTGFAVAERPAWASEKDKAKREQMKENWKSERDELRDDSDSDDENDDSDDDNDRDKAKQLKNKHKGKHMDHGGHDIDALDNDAHREHKNKMKGKAKKEQTDGADKAKKMPNDAQLRKEQGTAPGKAGEKARPSEQGQQNAKKWWQFWQ